MVRKIYSTFLISGVLSVGAGTFPAQTSAGNISRALLASGRIQLAQTSPGCNPTDSRCNNLTGPLPVQPDGTPITAPDAIPGQSSAGRNSLGPPPTPPTPGPTAPNVARPKVGNQ